MEQIKNGVLTVEIAEHGAELQSIKDADGQEYLWDGDAQYWGRKSPILFPIVCGLWKNTFRINGKEYHMERHGFARDTNFTVLAKGENRIVLGLHDNAETYKVYPYHFNLAISYKLVENKLHVVWHVENTDSKDIFFQIGGHPAFMVPGCKKGEPMKAKLRLDEVEPHRVFGNVEGCLKPGYHKVETKDGLWEIDEDTFKDDAVIFDHQQVKHVELLDENDRPALTLDFKSPAVGIWTPAGKHAPFICIEPWYGIHDWAEYDGEFKDRYLMNKLQPGASFMSEYTITIGE